MMFQSPIKIRIASKYPEIRLWAVGQLKSKNAVTKIENYSYILVPIILKSCNIVAIQKYINQWRVNMVKCIKRDK